MVYCSSSNFFKPSLKFNPKPPYSLGTQICNHFSLLINSNIIDEILEKGRLKALEIAKNKYEEVKTKVGLGA